MSIIKINTKKEFLTKMIDIVLLLNLPEEYQLREREKEFIVESIIISNEGIPLESREMVVEICKRMNLKSHNIYNYRKDLKKKGWLIQTKSGLKLNMALDYTYRDIPKVINFKFSLSNEQQEE